MKLFDITRGLPRRVEAQFRRHWSFVPGLWNLYFREQVNLGSSLRAVSRGAASVPQEQVEQDAAMAAADLYEKLQTGYYRTADGKRRRVDGDVSKLRFTEGVTPKQARLLADFNFRTSQVPGTQEMRTKIGHICFWGSVVYGNGIFMTFSPGERHNHLAIRLSRYRAMDPYLSCQQDGSGEANWIGKDSPSLEAKVDDCFEIQVPGYDLRRFIQARDPLAPALAFAVQVRVKLATLFGIRMCSRCPHCCMSDTPCQDAFGSNAEPMGGIGGRSDGLCGAVECQKISGSLHIHFWNYIQRAHQYHSLKEIAEMLETSLLDAADMKNFCANLCCEEYPLETDLTAEEESIEKHWPCFHERDGLGHASKATWGNYRFGRIAPFLWRDSEMNGDAYTDVCKMPNGPGKNLAMKNLEVEATQYKKHFQRCLQENQKCAQHHIHKKNSKTGERFIPNACQSAKCKATCKHDFPMLTRMNRKRPLLVCKGIVKKWNLKTNGARLMHGCILGLRNSPWLNGTAPGLCVGLSGSNTDVKLNDRLPIIEATHEKDECSEKCIPRDPGKRRRVITRMVRRTAEIQARINGYFGGYQNALRAVPPPCGRVRMLADLLDLSSCRTKPSITEQT